MSPQHVRSDVCGPDAPLAALFRALLVGIEFRDGEGLAASPRRFGLHGRDEDDDDDGTPDARVHFSYEDIPPATAPPRPGCWSLLEPAGGCWRLECAADSISSHNKVPSSRRDDLPPHLLANPSPLLQPGGRARRGA